LSLVKTYMKFSRQLHTWVRWRVLDPRLRKSWTCNRDSSWRRKALRTCTCGHQVRFVSGTFPAVDIQALAIEKNAPTKIW